MSKKPKMKTATTTQTVTPPDWAQGPLEQQFNRVYRTDLSPAYNEAMTGALEGGLGAVYDTGGTIDPALDYYQRTMAGEYLTPEAIGQAANPYIREFMPQLSSQYAAADRLGSGAQNYAAAQGISDIIARQYQTERDRQQQMAGAAPAYEALRLSPYDTAYRFGQQQRAEEVSDAMAELQKLQALTGAAAPWATRIGEQPYQSGGGSGLGNLLGMGLSIAGMATGNPLLSMAGKGMGFLSGAGATGGALGGVDPRFNAMFPR